MRLLVHMIILVSLVILSANTHAEEKITFQTAKIADNESVERTKRFLEAVYRQHYTEGTLEIEIINPINKPLPQRWERNDSGGKSLYVYWKYHVWYNHIHMDCDTIGLPTIKKTFCSYRQEVEP